MSTPCFVSCGILECCVALNKHSLLIVDVSYAVLPTTVRSRGFVGSLQLEVLFLSVFVLLKVEVSFLILLEV